MAIQKKVIYFLDFPFFVGGSNKVLLTQAYIMKQRGMKVIVVIPNDKNGCHAPEYDKICENYGLDILTECYSVSICMESIDITAALDEYQDLVKLIRTCEPDLIHSTQLNIAVELAARELKIPHLMNIYQIDMQNFNIDWLKVYPQYHSADSMLFSNRWSNGLGIPSKCIRVAYEQKENLENKRKNKGDDFRIHILSIGVLCEHKNQLEILKFILKCRMNQQNVVLRILGNDQNEYGDICKKFVKENGLEDRVEFIGFALNVEDYFMQTDLFILSSMVESYPGVIVESMANKVPILSTPVAGVPELLFDGNNGFLTEGYRAENIYQAFLRYLDYREEGRINQIIENAYVTYLKEHTYGSVGKQLDEYYRWIIEDYHKKQYFYLTADNIKQKFEKFVVDRKIEKQSVFMDHLWFLYHLIPILEIKSNTKVAVWGAGFWGKIVLDWIKLLEGKIHLVGYIDSIKTGKYMGYPILEDKERAIDECGTILVALADRKGILEIMNVLDVKGKIRNQDYFLVCNSPLIRI